MCAQSTTHGGHTVLDEQGGKTYLNQDTAEGGFVRARAGGKAKEKNKKSRSRGGDGDVVDDNGDDDDDGNDDDGGYLGRDSSSPGVAAPGILLFGFFRRAGERKNVQRRKSTAVLRCPAVSSFYLGKRGGRISAVS